MGVKLTNTNQFDAQARAEIYNILANLLPQLQVLSRRKIQEAYNSTFGRNPKDTGESEGNTITFGESQLRPYPLIKQIFESQKLTPFIYFAEPLQPKNPNFKYGRRNTVISARDKLAQQLGLTNIQS